MKKAYSYIRFSTNKQLSGDSLKRQLDLAEEYCNKNNLELDSTSFRDLGVSAFKSKNSSEDNALGQFLKVSDHFKAYSILS